MATTNVPIEIVLQDPNDPIVPTPDSDGGSDNTNTNSNIAVPNTALGEGHTTTDGSNTGGFFSSSSSGATIIPAVVLTLALGAVVALLVRRHYKNKKTDAKKATKQERLATAITSTVAILAATVLVGQLGMTATNAAVANEGTFLSTPDKIQIVANRYEDVVIVASTKAVSYASTDTSFGYKIFMSMAGDNANLYLDGDTASEYYFAPTTRTGLDINSWGYNFDGEADYTAMPLVDAPLMAQQNTNPIENEEFDVYYTMKADKDMPFGVYSGEIAYDIEGYKGFPTSLTTMQQMTPEICAAVYTPGDSVEDVVPTATLIDTRDNKTYEVAKLADGNCWMTQNLDLQKEDLLEGVTLDSTNTDDPANGFTLPVSQIDVTDNNKSWGDYGSETDIETAHVYDIAKSGMTYNYCLLYAGDCVEEGDEIPLAALGNLYNWYTATAGTGTFAAGSGGENPYEATGSICPAGWRLPNNSNSGEATEYSTLLSLYGITGSPTSSSYIGADRTAIYKTPLSFVPTGYYNNRLSGVGLSGYLWSSLAYSSTDARSYTFYSGFVQPWLNGRKIYGQGVRCIAK